MKYTILCQRAWRMKQFRRHLTLVREEVVASQRKRKREFEEGILSSRIFVFCFKVNHTKISTNLEQERQLKMLKYTLQCQKAYRMKRFRKHMSEYRASLMERCALVVQQKWRMIKFRRHLEMLKQEAEYQANLLKYTISCQKWLRYKNFKRNLARLRNERQIEIYQEKLLEATILCQQMYRYKRFKRNLNRLKQERQYQIDLLHSVIVCQKCIRYKNFKLNLNRLRHERQQEIEYQQNRLKSAILCQRIYRYKQFKLSLARLRQEKQYQIDLVNSAVLCQRLIRYKNFKLNLTRLRKEKHDRLILLNKSATIIQQQWRMYKFRVYMCLYRKSVCTIQSWMRNGFKKRLEFLKLRNLCIQIQRRSRAVLARRQTAAICIQTNFRMYIECRRYLYLKKSAVIIQQWFRSKKERIQFLKLKRSLPLIQTKCRKLIVRRDASARKIQMLFRYVKFRAALGRCRNAAITIQNWTRSPTYRSVKIKRNFKNYIFRWYN